MDSKLYKDVRTRFSGYLTEKGLRRTEERDKILEQICAFPGHFDIDMLYRKMQDSNFHVSKSTLYNTVQVLVDAGVLVGHPIPNQAVQYELRSLAEGHLHLICTECYTVKELKHPTIKAEVSQLKTARFTPEFFSLYIYGLCMRCRRARQKKIK